MATMEGKVCIITGGAGSIGMAAAHALLQEGARVMLVDQNRDDLARAAQILDASDDSIGIVEANVADSAAVRNYVDQTVVRWGKIDVIFSHAGMHI